MLVPNALSSLSHQPLVCVLGLGYIGLPTASLLCSRGLNVMGVDVNRHVVETINRGDIHIQEPDLDVMVRQAVESGRLKAFLQPTPADVFLIAVPTPFREQYQPDLSYVEAAADSLAPVLKKDNLVVLESTSPVGTTEMIAQRLQQLRPDLKIPGDIYIAYCPERVLPGQIIKELVENDRVVGGIDQISAEKAALFYSHFVQGEVLKTHARTAEMVKLSENAFRDVNIAFANELALVCSRLGIDVWQLISYANRHPRVNILKPGPGVGGHCIAVDPWFIIASCPQETPLMRAAREVNDSQPHRVVHKIISSIPAKTKAPSTENQKTRVVCLGLAYKANIDDLRESPSVEIALELARHSAGLEVWAVEPYIETLPDHLQQAGVQLKTLPDALKGGDIFALLVDHKEFLRLNLQDFAGRPVIDTRGLWNQSSFGLVSEGIKRG